MTSVIRLHGMTSFNAAHVIRSPIPDPSINILQGHPVRSELMVNSTDNKRRNTLDLITSRYIDCRMDVYIHMPLNYIHVHNERTGREMAGAKRRQSLL